MDMKQYTRSDKMNYSEIEKVIVAPQIVIYKNIFKHSKSLIGLLEEDTEHSKFSKWKEWYGQGIRKDVPYSYYSDVDDLSPEQLKKEKFFMDDISNCLEFIYKDYFNDFKANNGIWPDYINDWSAFDKYPGTKYIDYFKYTVHTSLDLDKDQIMMPYHVDEFIIPGQFKESRDVATINFYLNDEYEGGEICMYDSLSNKSYQYKPRPGDAVIMPSTYPFYHAVKSYRNHSRYFLRSFFSYSIKNIPGEMLDWDSIKKKEEEYVKNDLQLIKVTPIENLVE
jgi:2OG-Fe(II) oxygenase superfamily